MTAVEYVSEELRNLDIAYEMGLDKYEFQKLRKELVNKAKKMEQVQLEEAYKKGFNDASPSNNDFGSISIGKN